MEASIRKRQVTAAYDGVPPDSAGSHTVSGGAPSPQLNCGGCDHSSTCLPIDRAAIEGCVVEVDQLPKNWAH